MAAVFISYRREDSKGFTGALVRELKERFGADNVFIDYEDIEGGIVFPIRLDEAVKSCTVFIAIIGKKWIDAQNEQGKRRLDDPHDFVRQEIAKGLERNKRIIPVLIDGAKMPEAEQLPEDLKPLTAHNALVLTNQHWDEDVARLTDHIKEGLYATGIQQAASAILSSDFSPIPPMSKLTKKAVIILFILGAFFSAIGLALGIVEFNFGKRTARSDGKVIGFNNDGVHYPVVSFTTARGETIEFQSSYGSNPPAYDVGAGVRVKYDPKRPGMAEIDSVAKIMFFVLLFSGFGVSSVTIGFIPMLVRIARRRRLINILRDGRPIIATFHSVEEDTTVKVQNRHPYRVVAEWRNPISKELVHFRSHGVWKDPTEQAKKRLITVVVDPNNFRRYVVDLSFLA